MAVWKPHLDFGDQFWNKARGGSGLDYFVDLLEKDRDSAELRRQLGEEMWSAEKRCHRGWVAESKIRSAKTRPGHEAEAAAWLAARGLRVPSGRSAKKVLAREIQRHIVADGNDWPPSDAFDLDIIWTARPT